MKAAVDNSDGSSSISLLGFVNVPGRYAYTEGMTIEDALDDAGGYAACDSCQAFWEDKGGRGHTTYDKPPRVKRVGQRLQLPERRVEWSQFVLEPDDEIEFRHVVV